MKDADIALERLTAAAKRGINEYLASIGGANLFGANGRLVQVNGHTLNVKASDGTEFTVQVFHGRRP